MSVEKSEIKKLVIGELGATVEDQLEVAKREVDQSHGAHIGLLQVIKKVEELGKHVDRDMDEGKYNDLDGPLAVATVIKLYLQRAVGVIGNMSKVYENRHLMATGRVSAFGDSVKLFKKLQVIEENKVENIRAVMEKSRSDGSNGEDKERRVTGIRPNMTIKQRRQVEVEANLTGETEDKKPKVRKMRRILKDAENS